MRPFVTKNTTTTTEASCDENSVCQKLTNVKLRCFAIGSSFSRMECFDHGDLKVFEGDYCEVILHVQIVQIVCHFLTSRRYFAT